MVRFFKTIFALIVPLALMVPAFAEERLLSAGSPGTAVEQGRPMKFLLTFTARGDKSKRDEVVSRFKKTRGEPPEGVKLLGRWTRLDFSRVYVLVETNDTRALARYAYEWSDLTDVQTFPVMEDRELVDVLGLSD
jgi:hypothetical protein